MSGAVVSGAVVSTAVLPVAAMSLAVMSVGDVLRNEPLQVAASATLLCIVTLALGALIRRWLRRATSLRRIVVTVVLASLSLGVLSAALAARLMLLDGAELRAFLAVLIVAAAFAVMLAVYVARPLAVDIRRLEATVRSIEAGDRVVRSGIVRADELGHVARALDDLTGRLDTLERERAAVEDERRTLLSSVGHDLRTPLASIRAAVEALVDGVAADPDRYLRAMQHDVTALTALVDDLFLLSKLDAGRVDLDRVAVDLAELTDETLDSLAPIAAERGVELRLIAPTAVPVFGSPTALSRVVRNLVDNAIRHAPAATAVSVSVVRGASDNGAPGGVTVHVHDLGPGFPDGFQATAFDRFSRSDPARTRATGGAGLGLSIARGLVEAHGGEIWIDDVDGAQVSFRIPAPAPA
ncbi:MAG TPA: HAMP domain-containing sensor histidine kinase [Ilumatobacteraceae bacterium]